MSYNLFTDPELAQITKSIYSQLNGMSDAISSFADAATTADEWDNISNMAKQQADLTKLLDKNYNFTLTLSEVILLKEAVDHYLEFVEINWNNPDDQAQLFISYTALGKLEATIHYAKYC